MNVYKQRKINLKEVLNKFRTQKEFSDISGISRAQVSQLISDNDKYRIGTELARKIEQTAAKPDGWLDADHSKAEDDIEDIDLIVRTVSIVNKILSEHDVQASRMKREAYEHILRSAITNSVKLGVVTDSQVQHTLFSTQLQSFTS